MSDLLAHAMQPSAAPALYPRDIVPLPGRAGMPSVPVSTGMLVSAGGERVTRARYTMYRPSDTLDAVPQVIEGWAAKLATLPDGRRQILSFLLPGDLVSPSLLFDRRPCLVVEAITDVRHRLMRRNEGAKRPWDGPRTFAEMSRLFLEEQNLLNDLIVNLGRRSADQRVARLIVQLRRRLLDLGMAGDRTMPFPLRQHHIADATGLTSVHVSRLLTKFRKLGLLTIGMRTITIDDPDGLERAAGVNGTQT